MKKLLTIFLLLFLVTACTTQKHKTKEKTKTEISTKELSSIAEDLKTETKLQTEKKDSVSLNTDFAVNKSFATIAQNLKLSNNGKCTDGGEIRFMKFTDAQGNQTEIPVNDNTDLSFSSTAELENENKTLKSQVNQLTIENTNLQAKVDQMAKKQSTNQYSEQSSDVNTKTDSERSQFTAFLWCIGLTIILWEAGKFYVKKQFSKP